MSDPSPQANLSEAATRARLAAIVESSYDAIISMDVNGIITTWNRAAQRIYGYTEGETIGQPITMLIPEDRLSEETDILRKIRQGERVDHFETIRKRKNGTLLDVSLTISPIKDDSGAIIGASKSARDITERKRTEQELRKLTEELDERVAIRTHELTVSQERLRALANELSLAEERVRRHLANELHDYLGQLLVVCRLKIMRAIQRAEEREVNQDLRDADRILQDSISYTRSLVAQLTPPVLREFGLVMGLTWLAEQMKQHGLTVSVEIGAASLDLREDQAILLFQCVRELLMNIVKHAGTKDAALIIVLNADRQLTITVSDHGKGFDPSAEQVKDDRHFGLFSIRERMGALGGKMAITSAPGEGTTASLILALEEPSLVDSTVSATPPTSNPISVEGDRQPVKILLVDDHPLVRQGLRGIVDGVDNMQVVGEAADGYQAVQFIKTHRPDVVVMDVNMPTMDGIEATRLIRRNFPEVAVIGLSVHNSDQIASAMREAGVMAYLKKDVAPEELQRTIAMVKAGRPQ
jgi:PAS domain S-box-containing protein